jgi:hypothetical protein
MAYIVDRVVICDAFREPDRHYPEVVEVLERATREVGLLAIQSGIAPLAAVVVRPFPNRGGRP